MTTDILLDDNGDLAVKNGDLAVGADTEQRQRLILGSAKNDFKQFPEMGVGFESFLDDENEQALFAEVREQFKLDGMTLTNIGFDTDGNIYINGDED